MTSRVPLAQMMRAKKAFAACIHQQGSNCRSKNVDTDTHRGSIKISAELRVVVCPASQLRLEHFSENLENAFENGALKGTQSPEQTLSIDCPNLIEHDQAGLALELAPNPKGIRFAGGGERRDDHRLQVSIQLVGRNHKARAGLFDLATTCRIQAHKMNLPPLGMTRPHHRHSSSSNRVGEGVSSRSRDSTARRRAASAQPVRGGREAVITTLLSSTRSSTSWSSPTWSITAFGRRTPREFPILTRRAFMVITM